MFDEPLNPCQIFLAQRGISREGVFTPQLSVFVDPHLVIGEQIDALAVTMILVRLKKTYHSLDVALAVVDSLEQGHAYLDVAAVFKQSLQVFQNKLVTYAGELVMAVGIYFFKFSNNFTFGGITGLAVLVAKSGAISAGDFSFVANMVLLIIGFFVLGRKFAAKTAYSSILLSVALSGLERICPLSHPLTDQPLLELIFAIALPSIGSAVLFNIGASSGGTDIIALILKKYTSVNIGTALFFADLLAVWL